MEPRREQLGMGWPDDESSPFGCAAAQQRSWPNEDELRALVQPTDAQLALCCLYANRYDAAKDQKLFTCARFCTVCGHLHLTAVG